MTTKKVERNGSFTLPTRSIFRIALIASLLLISHFAEAQEVIIQPGRVVSPVPEQAQTLEGVSIEPGKHTAKKFTVTDPATEQQTELPGAELAAPEPMVAPQPETTVIETSPAPAAHHEIQMQNGVLIVPGRAVASRHATHCGCDSCSGSRHDLAKQYKAVYNEIPFLRSEYNVNRSYRHDATMEILLGELREQNIQHINIRQSAPAYSTLPLWPNRSSLYYRSPLGWNRTNLRSLPASAYGVPGYGYSNNWVY